MKGPIAFLLSLAGAAAVVILVLIPAVRERDHLGRELVGTADSAANGGSVLDTGIRRLRTELGDSAGPSALDVVRRLVSKTAIGTPAIRDGREFSFRTEWSRLPAIFRGLEPVSAALVSVRVQASDSPADCRVSLVLEPVLP